MKKIAVIGLGYVGLPLTLLAEKKGFAVVGLEHDKKKLEQIKNKKSELEDSLVNEILPKSTTIFTDTFEEIKSAEIVIICVPTPVDDQKMPDLSLVKSATLSAVKHMKKNSLLVIESTINPGVCDEVIIPLIESETDHSVGRTIFLAHCPERINPGDPKWNVQNIDRVVGADSPIGLTLAYSFYSELIDAKVKKMQSLKEAEAVKIVENTFRDINIAFVNELAMSFASLGINVNNVIDGAATKPFAFMPHYPGIGIGGHCIPVDPYYLIEYARGNGFEHEFLSLARSINENMPLYAVNLLEKTFLEKEKRSLDGVKVTVLGLSYKADVGDDRESPAYVVIDALKRKGALVTTYDPYIKYNTMAKNLFQALKDQDAAIIVTGHKEFTDLDISSWQSIKVVLDGRNVLFDQKKVFDKHNIHYLGIGVV